MFTSLGRSYMMVVCVMLAILLLATKTLHNCPNSFQPVFSQGNTRKEKDNQESNIMKNIRETSDSHSAMLKTGEEYNFTPLSHPFSSPGTFTLQDVCIEDHPFHKNDAEEGGKEKTTKKKKIIVIYNADHDSVEEELLSVSKHNNSKSKGWPVIYRRGAMLGGHVADHPAFFMGTTCPGNLHHFTTDSLISEYKDQGQVKVKSKSGQG